MNYIFDMDDTLCKTTKYVKEHILKWGESNLSSKSFLELKEMCNKNTLEWEGYWKDLLFEKVFNNEKFILEVKPTRLFNYFFLIPGNLPRGVNVSICTHRGDFKHGLEFTKKWFKQFDLAVTIKDIHCIPSDVSKVPYLIFETTGNFLLIDDNPLGIAKEEIHDFNPFVRIYDEECKYDCYKNQSKVIFQNGLFIIE